MKFSAKWMWGCLFGCISAGLAIAQANSPSCASCSEWNQPQTPFRIFGNSYYVGPYGLSVVLITSKSGHVLIDGALPESVSLIVSNIRLLGFRIEDVRLIVNSHVHFDHAGGIAELQRLSGARVVASPWSATVLTHGGVAQDDPQNGTIRPIAPVNNVHELHDGESFRVGEIAITAHLTPGHTPGGTSWTWQSCEGSVCRNMVFADSLSPISAEGFRFSDSRIYPHALADFDQSFRFLETVPCDYLITTHPDASDLWDRIERRKRGVTPDPLMDSGACRQLAEQGRERLRERLAQEHMPSK